MTRTEIRKAIKKCNKVFGWVTITNNDGHYIELVKKNCLLVFSKDFDNDININAVLRDCNDLYIN